VAQIIWTEPALSDLNEIAEYIALDNVTAAQNLVERVFSKTERLKQFPKSGRVPPEIKASRYREVIVGPCRVFYRMDKNNIVIVYVMRSERLLRQYLMDRESS
jgi:toxin ParE1/3/4